VAQGWNTAGSLFQTDTSGSLQQRSRLLRFACFRDMRRSARCGDGFACVEGVGRCAASRSGLAGLPRVPSTPIEPWLAVAPLPGSGPLAPVPANAQTTAPRGPCAAPWPLRQLVCSAPAIPVAQHLPAKQLALQEGVVAAGM